MDICSEATEELQRWLSDWIAKHRSSLSGWLSVGQLQLFVAISKRIVVDWETFKVNIPRHGEMLFKEMEIGSRKMPQFHLISMMNNYLEMIYSRYKKAHWVYCANAALRKRH